MRQAYAYVGIVSPEDQILLLQTNADPTGLTLPGGAAEQAQAPNRENIFDGARADAASYAAHLCRYIAPKDNYMFCCHEIYGETAHNPEMHVFGFGLVIPDQNIALDGLTKRALWYPISSAPAVIEDRKQQDVIRAVRCNLINDGPPSRPSRGKHEAPRSA